MEINEKTISEFIQQIEDRCKRIESGLLLQKAVLNFEELAEYTGLSKSHLYKMTSTGGIPCYKPKGKHIYFDRAEVDKWLLRNRKATTEEIEIEASTHVTLKRKGKGK